MGRPIKIEYLGKQVEGEDLEFDSIKEGWDEFKTEDGTIVKVKLYVSNVIRAKDLKTESGEPLYIVKHGTIVTTVVPEKLKKSLIKRLRRK